MAQLVDLNNENHRLATFITMTHNEFISLIKLAKAGFFFNDQKIQCFSCGRSYEGRGMDDNPWEKHDWNCQFFIDNGRSVAINDAHLDNTPLPFVEPVVAKVERNYTLQVDAVRHLAEKYPPDIARLASEMHRTCTDCKDINSILEHMCAIITQFVFGGNGDEQNNFVVQTIQVVGSQGDGEILDIRFPGIPQPDQFVHDPDNDIVVHFEGHDAE